MRLHLRKNEMTTPTFTLHLRGDFDSNSDGELFLHLRGDFNSNLRGDIDTNS